MSPLSAPVLGGAALISAPALWGAFVAGTTPTEVALTRFLVCAVLCWAGLALVSLLVGPSVPARSLDRADTGDTAVAAAERVVEDRAA